MFNEMGERVLEYSYDAWGNIYTDMRLGDYESIQASSEAIIYTPITYRGYMYDYYTGLYYLQSRYYNPLYGRFLNVDDNTILEKASGTIHGANLFAYCNNNPVMNVDYTGEFAITLSTIVIGILTIIILFVIIACILNDDSDEIDDAIEYIEKIEELYDISEDYWFVFYYHAKNVIEYGTGINRNPTLPYFYEMNLGDSYTEFCCDVYDDAIIWGIINRGDYWGNFSQDEKISVTREIMGLTLYFRERVISLFARKFLVWGTEVEKMILETVIDFGQI